MIHFVVVDTDVLVSALLTSKEDSATVQIVKKILDGELIPLFSEATKKEYREVLHRAKFGLSPDAVDYLLSAIFKSGISLEPASTGIAIIDAKDLPFYELTLEKRKDQAYLITGNLRHFPKEPFVVTPREILEILEKE